MEGYRLFRRDGQMNVSRYIRKRFDYTVFTVSGDVVENLCVRIKGVENKGNDVVDVCY